MSLLLFSNTTIEENENIFKNDKESSMTLNIIDSFNNENFDQNNKESKLDKAYYVIEKKNILINQLEEELKKFKKNLKKQNSKKEIKKNNFKFVSFEIISISNSWYTNEKKQHIPLYNKILHKVESRRNFKRSPMRKQEFFIKESNFNKKTLQKNKSESIIKKNFDSYSDKKTNNKNIRIRPIDLIKNKNNKFSYVTSKINTGSESIYHEKIDHLNKKINDLSKILNEYKNVIRNYHSLIDNSHSIYNLIPFITTQINDNFNTFSFFSPCKLNRIFLDKIFIISNQLEKFKTKISNLISENTSLKSKFIENTNTSSITQKNTINKIKEELDEREINDYFLKDYQFMELLFNFLTKFNIENNLTNKIKQFFDPKIFNNTLSKNLLLHFSLKMKMIFFKILERNKYKTKEEKETQCNFNEEIQDCLINSLNENLSDLKSYSENSDISLDNEILKSISLTLEESSLENKNYFFKKVEEVYKNKEKNSNSFYYNFQIMKNFNICLEDFFIRIINLTEILENYDYSNNEITKPIENEFLRFKSIHSIIESESNSKILLSKLFNENILNSTIPQKSYISYIQDFVLKYFKLKNIIVE